MSTCYSELFANLAQFEPSNFGSSAAVKACFCLLLSLVYGLAQPYCLFSTAITPTGFLLPVTSLLDRLSSRNCESFLYIPKLKELSLLSLLPHTFIVSLSIPVKLLKPHILPSLSFMYIYVCDI